MTGTTGRKQKRPTKRQKSFGTFVRFRKKHYLCTEINMSEIILQKGRFVAWFLYWNNSKD